MGREINGTETHGLVLIVGLSPDDWYQVLTNLVQWEY